MADGTKIEWTDATWNVINGCSVVSPGCTNCYAMKLAGTRMRNHPSRKGLTIETKAGPVWNGEVRFNEHMLDEPLRKRRPRMIFVCAHGDLFAENVPDDWIDRVFAVMALAPHHTFQVLTKRAERMREYLTAKHRTYRIALATKYAALHPIEPISSEVMERLMWPLPNVWLGVSAEDRRRWDERVPILFAMPAAVRWVSAEPLLGPLGDVDLTDLDWVVVGGESGAGARPMHPDWARAIRDQCATVDVAFLFKQWGEWAPAETPASETQEDEELRGVGVMLDGQYLRRIGKAAAGRVLDGVTHDGYPEVRR